MIPLAYVLTLSAVMAAAGVIGIVAKRNALAMLISAELILNGANVAFAGFARQWQLADGQIFALVVMTIAACEGAVGLALIVALYRKKRHIRLDEMRELRG